MIGEARFAAEATTPPSPGEESGAPRAPRPRRSAPRAAEGTIRSARTAVHGALRRRGRPRSSYWARVRHRVRVRKPRNFRLSDEQRASKLAAAAGPPTASRRPARFDGASASVGRAARSAARDYELDVATVVEYERQSPYGACLRRSPRRGLAVARPHAAASATQPRIAASVKRAQQRAAEDVAGWCGPNRQRQHRARRAQLGRLGARAVGAKRLRDSARSAPYVGVRSERSPRDRRGGATG